MDDESIERVAERASALVPFADGLADAGLLDTARRVRIAACDLAEIVDALRAERAARTEIQVARDNCVEFLGRHAYDALRS